MIALRTLSIGTDEAPAQFPIRDFSRATETALASGVDVVVSLPAGHYEIRSDAAFAYKHGRAAEVAGFVAVPHDANVWLGVSLGESADLVVTPAGVGTLWIVPAEVY
ncbi:hypothetical protein [Paracoccus beibuensis]|uniref:hypothetical protein n=1 Tax=Paracoccus beibuensis TaxID=547602 RepID=UPI0022400D7B|nr:hypothetical protein [Paracoccus beibuensis]